MNKKQFDKDFITIIAKNLKFYTTSGFLDKGAVRLEYNVAADSLCKNGEITQHQYNNWVIPDRFLSLSYLVGYCKRYRIC